MSSAPGNIVTARLLGERYQVLSLRGVGASAGVFRVRDVRTGAIRAAKVLKTEYAANAETLARFEDEFRILRTLRHPHLPEIFDYGWTDDGGRFLIMELVDGEPLDHYFRAHPEDIWVILYELCETLVFVHARNLLHQDIKPSNILVTRVVDADGERPLIKLIDFGLTHRRGVGAAVRLVGTADYIAPEVVRGERTLTRAVDYYSLGATLFELLSGAPPFAGSENEVLRAHLEREPVIEHEELEWAELYPHVRAMLAKDAQARLAAFEEFRRAVVARVTGGIDDLDHAYALARIDSLGMIGKKDAWEQLSRWLDASVDGASRAEAHTFSISGSEGVGKRFLTGSLRAEAALRGVRTVSPSEIGVAQHDVAATRQPALMWSRLLEACEKEPVVLVVERPLLLPDEERSFVRLAGTQWELFRSRGRVLPLFFLVVVDSTTEDSDTLDYLPSDGAIKLELAALGKDDRAQIVDQFRGSMFDVRDARALTTYLERFDDAGSAIQGLQRAVLRGGLTFLGQRWKVQPGLLTEVIKTEQSGAFSHDLVASLSAVERSVVAVVTAHPDPVPLSWIAGFLAAEKTSVPAIVAAPLKRLLSVSGDTVSPVSASVRGALRAGCDPEERHRAHEFLAARLVGLERSVASDRTLAFHYEQLGRVRDAARVHLRLLHAYWSIRPRERPYELIEGICRSGLELLEAHGTTVSASTRRHLFCFYIKEWIKAFWARNLFTHAKPVIDEWTKRLGQTMPASVAPRYVRSAMEVDGPEKALSVLQRLRTGRAISPQLAARFALEGALILHNIGSFQGAFDELATVVDTVTTLRDHYRRAIYHAMNLDETEGINGDGRLPASVADEAYRQGCVDEALLMRGLRTRLRSGQGDPVGALKEAAIGLRIAHKSGLGLRENFFYRVAATISLEMNDARRARARQQRALQVAGTLGLHYMVGTSWARFSETERILGRFGNSLSYGRLALSMMGSDAPARDRIAAQSVIFGAAVLLRVPDEFQEVGEEVRNSNLPNDRAHFYLWRGRDLLLRGKFHDAVQSLRKAQREFDLAGYPFNSVWAAFHEARVTLMQLDKTGYEHLMTWIRPIVGLHAPPVIQFEFRVVELKARYVFRQPVNETLVAARECRAMMPSDGDVLLRIELAQTLFRIFARVGNTAEANQMFDSYRGLVTGVLANVDKGKAADVAEWFSLSEMMGEYAVLVARNENEGPEGPRFGTRSQQVSSR